MDNGHSFTAFNDQMHATLLAAAKKFAVHAEKASMRNHIQGDTNNGTSGNGRIFSVKEIDEISQLLTTQRDSYTPGQVAQLMLGAIAIGVAAGTAVAFGEDPTGLPSGITQF